MPYGYSMVIELLLRANDTAQARNGPAEGVGLQVLIDGVADMLFDRVGRIAIEAPQPFEGVGRMQPDRDLFHDHLSRAAQRAAWIIARDGIQDTGSSFPRPGAGSGFGDGARSMIVLSKHAGLDSSLPGDWFPLSKIPFTKTEDFFFPLGPGYRPGIALISHLSHSASIDSRSEVVKDRRAADCERSGEDIWVSSFVHPDLLVYRRIRDGSDYRTIRAGRSMPQRKGVWVSSIPSGR